MGFGGLISGSLFGKTKSISTPILSGEQKEITQQQVELGEFQAEELERQRLLQEETFAGAGSSLEEFEQFVASQTGDASQLDAAQDELLQDMLDRIRAGGSATPEEIELINSATEQALAAGESDITRFVKLGLEQLREELAPQLGLRPGDTPILDRGGRVAAEGARQQGQLVSSLRGQQFAARLGFPLQRAEALGGLNLGQQDRTQAIKAFQAQLTESAFINRLRLAQTSTSAGLGLAGAGQPNIAPLFGSVGQATIGTDPSRGLSETGSTISGFMSAAGSLGAGGPS